MALKYIKSIHGSSEPINPEHVTKLEDKTIDKANPITAIHILGGKKAIRVFGSRDDVGVILGIEIS
jgi:hypothetical protein